VLLGLFLALLVLETFELGQPEGDREGTVELFGPFVLHREVVYASFEQFPYLLGVFAGVVVGGHVDLGHNDLVDNGLGGEQFGYFEVVDEQLVALVVEGEVKVDQLVDVQVLQPRQVGQRDVGNPVDGHEGTVVVGHLGEEQVDLVLEQQLVELHVDLEGLEQLLLPGPALDDLDEPAVRSLDDILLLEDQLLQLRVALPVEPFAPFEGLVEDGQLVHGQFVVDVALFL
jgi:hypothetical protein